MLGGTSHSIGILSSAVLAWYQLSAMTATPPLKTRPRIKVGSGIGNCDAEMTPGSLRIALEIVALHRAAIDRAGLDGRPFHAGQRTSMP